MIDVVVTSAEGDSAIIVSRKYREAPCLQIPGSAVS